MALILETTLIMSDGGYPESSHDLTWGNDVTRRLLAMSAVGDLLARYWVLVNAYMPTSKSNSPSFCKNMVCNGLTLLNADMCKIMTCKVTCILYILLF